MLLFMMNYTNGKNGSALGVRVNAIVGPKSVDRLASKLSIKQFFRNESIFTNKLFNEVDVFESLPC